MSESTTPQPSGQPPFDAATLRENDLLPPLAQAIDNLILARIDEQMAHHHSMEHTGGWVEEEGWVNRTRAALANVVLGLAAPAPCQPDAAAAKAEAPESGTPTPRVAAFIDAVRLMPWRRASERAAVRVMESIGDGFAYEGEDAYHLSPDQLDTEIQRGIEEFLEDLTGVSVLQLGGDVPTA